MKNNEQKTDVKETVTVNFDIPSRIYLFGRRPVAETKEIVIEHLRNQAMSICELIAHGAAVVQGGHFDEKIFINSCGVLAKIAQNHIEAIEVVERDLDGEMLKASLTEAEKMTLSEMVFNRMADRLVTIIESPEISEATKEAIMSIVFTAASNASDDESRADFIERTFVRSMESFSFAAADAYIQSLQAVMESCIDDEVYQPILNANVEKFNEK